MNEANELATSNIARRRRQELVQERERTSLWRYFSSVGFGLLTTMTSVPAVRVKTLLQCRPEMAISGRETYFTGPWSCIQHIKRREGAGRFFRGFIPQMAWGFPHMFIRQASVWQFSKDGGEIPSAINSFVRGFASTSIVSLSSLIFMPIILAQTKMMSDVKPARRAIYEFQTPVPAIKRIIQFGGRSALWTGSLPFVMSNLVFFTSLFTSMAFASSSGLQSNYPVLTALSTAAFAIMTSHPLDTVRNRMQYRLHTQVTDYVPEYSGMMNCFRDIWRREGIRGFYGGTSAAMGAYTITLFWAFVSSIRSRRGVDKDSEAEVLTMRRQKHIEEHRQRFRQRQLQDEIIYGFPSSSSSSRQ